MTESGSTDPHAAAALAADLAETMAEFARRLGVARSTVTRAAQAGRLALRPDGRVWVAASLARWHGTRGGRDDMAALHAAARGGAIPHPHHHPRPENAATARLGGPAGMLQQQGANATGPAAPAGEPAMAPDRMAHQMARERWRNAALQLDIDVARGARVSRAAAVTEAGGLGAMLRAAVERLIDQTAPRVAAAGGDAGEQRRVLAAQVWRVRAEIRRELPRALRRLRPQHQAPAAGALGGQERGL